MKTNFSYRTKNSNTGSSLFFSGLLLSTLLIASCNNNDDKPIDEPLAPTAAAFDAIRSNALLNETQNFQITANGATSTITTDSGVQIDINTGCLTLNGNPVSGTVDVKVIELFDGGKMLVTDKTTMGQLPDGNMAMLQSGGEFYINATKNGQQLDITCNMAARIPASLTEPRNGMILWEGVEDANGNMDWKREEPNPAGQGGVDLGQGTAGAVYYAYFNSFGWTNVDKFYSFTGPKTQILSTVPSGYNFDNCAIYLHYDGEGNSLAKLDTYDPVTGQYSEHYGQVPVGLACHIIFATEDNGQWRYAIKPVTISANAVYNFTLAETILGTEAQLIAAINALP